MIKKIAVIGSGVMGAGIAAQIANAGCIVLLYDITPPDALSHNIIAQNAINKLSSADNLALMDLENINKQRAKEGLPKIIIVKKHSEVNLGIRAHPNMTVSMCLTSIILPHQNEFIFIWLFIGFIIYYIIQIGLIASHDD